MTADRQEEVVEFLKQSAQTGDPGHTARIIRTHISVIVLRGDKAWKLKRAIRLPYLDFSTPERRLQACEKEVMLNRRTAPSLYLGARRITRAADGRLELDGAGALVDAVVEMRRFEDDSLLSLSAAQGWLDPLLLESLARGIARFHAQADVALEADGAARMADVLALGEQADALPEVFGAGPAQALRDGLRAGLTRHAHCLDARAQAGRIRRCHGDLHLGNICQVDGVPTPFDCIEFNDAIATTDTLYDLAFLLMDLWHQGLHGEANRVFNRYLDDSGDEASLAPLPWFMAVRAAIRAQVLATQALQADDEAAAADDGLRHHAQGYFDLALTLLQTARPQLLAIGGLSGTGKSTLAAQLAPAIGAAPGARILATDRIRKQQAGVAPTTRLPAHHYTPQASQAVYAALVERAGAVLAGGWPVVADAVFARQAQRRQIADCARDAGVPFQGIWLQAEAATLFTRVAARRNDPSDATPTVLQAQLADHAPPEDWHRIDSRGDTAALVQDVLRQLAQRAD